jgi:hypothetical protein
MIIQFTTKLFAEDIEDEFSEFFPFLKIELQQITGLEDVSGSGALEISGDMTAFQLHHMLQNDWLMFAKIFRRNRTLWEEISDDDSLSLDEQNELGRVDSRQKGETRFGDVFEI